MLKIRDLLQECNLQNDISIIAIVRSVGNFEKYTILEKTQYAQEVYIYDDSLAMVKLIVLDRSYQDIEIHRILYFKNVKPLKVQNYVVLITLNHTIISRSEKFPETESLRNWLKQNIQQLQIDGYRKFLNLSIPPEVNTTEDKMKSNRNTSNINKNQLSKNVSLEKLEFYNDSTGCEKNKNDINLPNKSACKRPIQEKDNIDSGYEQTVEKLKLWLEEPPSKCIRTDVETIENSECDKNNYQLNLQQEPEYTMQLPKTPKIKTPNNKKNPSQITSDVNIEIVSTINDNENYECNMQNTIKVENNQEEKIEEITGASTQEKFYEEPLDTYADITNESFNALMNSLPLEEEWNEEKDKHLVNYILKNLTKLHHASLYNVLLHEKPHIFQGVTPDMLKERVKILADVKNYVYLIMLCGGERLSTENEKVIFMEKIERLRNLMRSTPKEEFIDSSVGVN